MIAMMLATRRVLFEIVENDDATLRQARGLVLFRRDKTSGYASTLYRGIRKGRYPKPLKVSPGSSRWLRDECEAALRSMVEGRAS